MASAVSSLIESSIEIINNTTSADVANYSIDLVKSNLFTPLGALSWGSLACIYLIGTEQEKSDYKKISDIFLKTVLAAGLVVGGITLAIEVQEPNPSIGTALKMTGFVALGAYRCYSLMNIGVSALLATNAAANKLQQQAEAMETKTN